jgi:hypothetical protein
MIRFKEFYELEETWAKTGKEATHIPTGQKTYEYAKLDKEGRPTGKRHYRNEKGKVMGESVEESKDFSKYIIKATKTEPKIVRKTNPAGRTTDHVEYEVHGTLSSHKRTFKSKKEAEAYFNTVKEDVELDEAVKLNSKVKIHHPGKSYHGEVGHVGEIRHGAYKGAPKTYTVDYGDRKSIQLDKANIKLHKEEAELEEGAPIVIALAPIDVRNPKKQQSRQDKPLTAYQQGVAAQGKPYKNPHPFDPKAGADVNYDHNQYRAGYKKQGVAEEKDPRIANAGVEGFNKAKRTPGHPTKSHIVVAKDGDKIKTIRFGEQGASTAGDPKPGESDKMKAKRKSFKARHGKNIAKGKMSAAYWADKEKW